MVLILICENECINYSLDIEEPVLFNSKLS